MQKDQTIILVGSNSLHTLRYLTGISSYFAKIIFITNDLTNLLLPKNVTPYCINFKLANLAARYQIAKLIKPYNNCLIHIQQANSYAYHTLKAVQLAKIKCKTILTTWGSDILILPTKNPLLKRMVQFNLQQANIITSDSLFMSAQIKKLSPQVQQLYTINFGMQHFPLSLDLGQKQDIILSNRLHKPLYNIDKIIQGFAQLIRNPYFAHYKLVIAAHGSQTQSLQHLAKQLKLDNQVYFTGMLSYSQLQQWYRQAKLFISIPESDATSLSVLEAMGFGCYPLLSNLPANLEWVINEVNGSICQNLDLLVTDIQDALNKIANPLDYQNLVQFNYALIKQKAVFETNLAKFISLY